MATTIENIKNALLELSARWLEESKKVDNPLLKDIDKELGDVFILYKEVETNILQADITTSNALLVDIENKINELNGILSNTIQFKGDTGENGKTVLSGTVAPLTTLGTIDDLYLNTTTWDMFKKTSDTVWTLQGNIKGAVPNAVTYGTRTRFGGGSDDTVNTLQVNGSFIASNVSSIVTALNTTNEISLIADTPYHLFTFPSLINNMYMFKIYFFNVTRASDSVQIVFDLDLTGMVSIPRQFYNNSPTINVPFQTSYLHSAGMPTFTLYLDSDETQGNYGACKLMIKSNISIKLLGLTTVKYRAIF